MSRMPALARSLVAFATLAGLASVPRAAAQSPAAPSEAAYRANNVGVGLLEQYDYASAATEFRRALAADPKLAIARVNLAIALLYAADLSGAMKEATAAAAALPSASEPHYVLGLVAKGENRVDDAIAELKKVLAAHPNDPGANVNLAQLYMGQKKFPDAVSALRLAVAGEPFSASAYYSLGIALTRSGQAAEGKEALDTFNALQKSGTAIVLDTSYPNQGKLTEALTSSGAEPGLVDPKAPEIRFVDASATLLPKESSAGSGAAARATLVDLDGDGDLDVIDAGSAGVRLLRNDGARVADATKSAGLTAKDAATGAVAADWDGDALPDLVILRAKGAALYRNEGRGKFRDVTQASGIPSGAPAAAAALVDADHDGDVDLVVAAASGAHRLLVNDGKGKLTDGTTAAKIAGDRAGAIALVPTDWDNHRDADLLVVHAQGVPRLFKNLRDGSFRDEASTALAGLPLTTGKVLCVAAGDLNKDSFVDFFFGREGARDLLALSNGRGGFVAKDAPTQGSVGAQLVDVDCDGVLDLAALSAAGLAVHRSLGGGAFQDLSAKAAPSGLAAGSLAAGDLDGDGDVDLVAHGAQGVRVLRNDGGNANASIRVRLAGRVSNKNGIGSKVEVRAGSLRQKMETFATTPSVAPADVVVGLGKRKPADAVRVLWPSGILQTETDPAKVSGKEANVEELDRKPSSCPYLYAWNGEEFAFVTDFMGGGEMGYRVGAVGWNMPIPEEYVRLDSSQLRERDGRYELRVTNELEEALFVDRLRLIAIDHPEDVLVFPNEGMVGAPRAPAKLYAVRGARPPLAAHDDAGRDVTERLTALDRRFVDGFPLESVRGYAQPHALILDLAGASANRAVLLLTGWTDYAFSSDNVAAAQRGLAMAPPSLEMEDDEGRWVPILPNLGIPVGRPQTVAVELGNHWPGKSRRVRIATTMRIYWDQAMVGELVDAPLVRAELDAASADFRRRGFSAEVTPDGREPFVYDYARVDLVSPWKVFPGRYTRWGDVRELLAASDDVFVISSPGDEIALSFDARALPALAAGTTRTFLMHADGYSKEMDINSATPDQIGPLPFHAMSRYPYEAPEAYPMTDEKLELFERYNTRIVPGPVPRLEAALTRGAAEIP